MKWFSDVTKTMAICSWMIMNTEVELPPTYATPFAFNHGWTSHVFKSQQCVMHFADEGFRYVSREELEHRSIRSYFRNGWQPYRTSSWHHSWNFFWHTWSIYLTWERNHHKLHIIIFLITVLCVLFFFFLTVPLSESVTWSVWTSQALNVTSPASTTSTPVCMEGI